PEDKVLAKLDFLKGCAAVYAASIGTSSIKRLMAAEIQPIIVGTGHEIVELLNEVSLALAHRGELPWVDRAVNRNKSPDRFALMAEEGWDGEVAANEVVSHRLITSLDELE
ncbi:MAG: vanadium nitrogenase, partial [Zoogloea sp.]|nr:vanadium nitrogenase [Zoogloea sp.]